MRISKYTLVVSSGFQSQLDWKALIFCYQLNSQGSATFGSTRIQHFTTTYSCHSCAKTMSSCAFDFAWLISSFHVNNLLIQ
jgi:hypothetical protein